MTNTCSQFQQQNIGHPPICPQLSAAPEQQQEQQQMQQVHHFHQYGSLGQNSNPRGRAIMMSCPVLEQRLPVNHAAQPMNSPKRFKGVRQRKGKWTAEISIPKNKRTNPNDKKTKWLGTFATAEEAASAYDREALRLKGPSATPHFPNSFPEKEAAGQLTLKFDVATSHGETTNQPLNRFKFAPEVYNDQDPHPGMPLQPQLPPSPAVPVDLVMRCPVSEEVQAFATVTREGSHSETTSQFLKLLSALEVYNDQDPHLGMPLQPQLPPSPAVPTDLRMRCTVTELEAFPSSDSLNPIESPEFDAAGSHGETTSQFLKQLFTPQVYNDQDPHSGIRLQPQLPPSPAVPMDLVMRCPVSDEVQAFHTVTREGSERVRVRIRSTPSREVTRVTPPTKPISSHKRAFTQTAARVEQPLKNVPPSPSSSRHDLRSSATHSEEGESRLPLSKIEAHLAELRPVRPEFHDVLVPFLSTHSSMLLYTNPLHRKKAYEVLGKFLLLVKRSSIHSLAFSSCNEFSYLLGALRDFSFDSTWLSRIEGKVLFPSSDSPLGTLTRIAKEKEHTRVQLNHFSTKVARVEESLSSLKASHRLCSEKYASLVNKEASLADAVNVPLFEF